MHMRRLNKEVSGKIEHILRHFIYTPRNIVARLRNSWSALSGMQRYVGSLSMQLHRLVC